MLTEQEQFWASDFGDQYVSRNRVAWKKRVPFWLDILAKTNANSVLEVGCNSGGNLKAIRAINPMLVAWGVDVNQAAINQASNDGHSVIRASLFDLEREGLGEFDLVASCGVLIHIAPADLERAMCSIIAASDKYVLAVEYADEKEVEVLYREHADRLWRRPYGRLYQDLGLKMVAEGEAPADAFDRCAFWLMSKP